VIVFIVDVVSLNFLEKIYKEIDILFSYDTGSLNFRGSPFEEKWLEFGIVDPETRVRLSPGVLNFSKEKYLSKEDSEVIKDEITKC